METVSTESLIQVEVSEKKVRSTHRNNIAVTNREECNSCKPGRVGEIQKFSVMKAAKNTTKLDVDGFKNKEVKKKQLKIISTQNHFNFH